jgi:hypothetical protein
MRTTVTIDPDVERLLEDAMRQTGQNFKVTLNQAVRKGLADTVSAAAEKPFVVEAQDMGACPGVDIANIHDLDTDLEVEAYLNVTRKLEQRRASAKTPKRQSKA